jgi:hypothetical protein
LAKRDEDNSSYHAVVISPLLEVLYFEAPALQDLLVKVAPYWEDGARLFFFHGRRLHFTYGMPRIVLEDGSLIEAIPPTGKASDEVSGDGFWYMDVPEDASEQDA